MGDEEQAIAYAKADFSSSNQMFVERLLEGYSAALKNVLDIGCGPGDVPVRLARAKPPIAITAVDASEPMVRLARRAVHKAGLQKQIRVVKGQVPGLAFEAGDFDALLSKDLLHHLPDPAVFWAEVKRLTKKGMVVFVMDLLRPKTERQARSIVESVSGREPAILKRDFYDSLRAAFTLAEIRQQLRDASLDFGAAQISERHLLVKGVT